jgi:RNA polymerase sigma-70 factor (ECF subfamily)
MNASLSGDSELLLQQARAGNGVALGQLLERHRAFLAVLARLQIGLRLQGKVDASDVVQEAFLGAARDFRQFQGATIAELRGWLRQILAAVVANLVRHYQGTQRRDVRRECPLPEEAESSAQAAGLAADQSSPSQQAARREQAELLVEALGRLADDERDLLILRHLEGLTFPEVAQRMGRTLDQVKKLWPRALTRLRQAFPGELP